MNLSVSPTGSEIRLSSDISFAKSNVIIVSGDNGIGKSTILKSLMFDGLITKYFTGDSSDFNNVDKVFSTQEFLEHKFVKLKRAQNLLENCFNADLRNFEKLLSSYELSPYLNKRLCDLSFGSKKKLIVLACLASRSQIILLDEPFENLDFNFRQKLADFLVEKSLDKKIVLTAHSSVPDNLKLIASYVEVL